jgi:tetratricopeptide (TPR) repeat protein
MTPPARRFGDGSRNFEVRLILISSGRLSDHDSDAYPQIKKGSKAVGYLNEAIKLDPAGKADAHLLLAALYNGAGMKDKAAAEYEAFLKQKPDYADRKKLEAYIDVNKAKTP